MAKIAGNLSFPGMPGLFTAYKQKGSDKINFRRKTGPSSQRFKTSPDFELPRSHGKEFGGRSTTGGYIRTQLSALKMFADQKLAGRMNTLLLSAQAFDTVNETGKRSVLLSKNPRLLEGLNINEHVLFDTVIRNPVNCSINREAFTARVDIPALVPGLNLFVPAPYTAYMLFPVFSVVPDFHFVSSGSNYAPVREYSTGMIDDQHETAWYNSRTGSPAMIIDLKLKELPPDNDFSLMVAVGIMFGHLDDHYIGRGQGTARILAMG